LYENRCNHFKMFHESYLKGSIPGFLSRDKLRYMAYICQHLT
jgi:hypothetical protein